MTSPNEPVVVEIAVTDGGSAAVTERVTAGLTGIATAAQESGVKASAALDRIQASTTGAVTATQRLGAQAVIAGTQASAAYDKFTVAAKNVVAGDEAAAASAKQFGAEAVLAAARAQDAMAAYAASAEADGAKAGAALAAGTSRGLASGSAAVTGTFKTLTSGLIGALAIGTGIELAKKAGEAAAEDAQGVRLVQNAFGDASKEVLEFGENAAAAFGLSAASSNTAAATFGRFFGTLGVGQDQAASLSTQLVGRAADLAKFSGNSTSSVEDAFTQVLRGRVVALKQYADISNTTLNSEAISHGLIQVTTNTVAVNQAQATYNESLQVQNKVDASLTATAVDKAKAAANVASSQAALDKATTGVIPKLDAQQKALAGVYAILDQTASKAGTYANSTDQLSTQQQTLQAVMENLAGTIGKALYPVLVSIGQVLVQVVVPAVKLIADAIAPVLSLFSNLPPVLQHAIGIFGVFVLLRGPVIAVFTALASGLGTAFAGLVSLTTRLAGTSSEFAVFDEAAQSSYAEMILAASAAGELEAELYALDAGFTEAAATATVAGDEIGTAMDIATGPIGLVALAVGAVVTALAFFTGGEKDAAAKVRDFSAAIDENTGKLGSNATAVISQQVADSVTEYVKLGGAYGDYTNAVAGSATAQASVKKTFDDSAASAIANSQAYKDNAQALQAAGYTADKVAQAVLAGGSAQDQLTAALKGTQKEYGGSADKALTARNATASATETVNTLKNAVTEQSDAITQYNSDLATIQAQLTKASDAAKDNKAATDAGTASTTTAAQANSGYGAGMRDIVLAQQAKLNTEKLAAEAEQNGINITKDAAEAQLASADAVAKLNANLDTLPDEVTLAQAALDKMAGRSPTVEQAFSDEAAAIDQLGQKFQLGTASAQVLGGGILYLSGQINTSTQAGRDLRDGTLSTRTAILSAAQAASDAGLKHGGLAVAQAAANKAATEGYNAFLNTSTQILGSRDAALKLAAAYGLVPKDIDTAVNLSTADAQKKLLALQIQAATITSANTVNTDVTNLFGRLFGEKKANGSWVTGGTPGQDSVPIMAMPDEFVVRAATAPSWGPELNYMNSHSKYADGGAVAVGGPNRSAGSPFGGKSVTIESGAIQVTIQVAADTSADQLAAYAAAPFRAALEREFQDDLDRRL